MSVIFFFVLQHRDSQVAYKILMSTKFPFKPFEIKGKNVVDKLKQYGIDKVPTLYFPDKRAKVEGSENIAKYLGVDYSATRMPANNKVEYEDTIKKPRLEAKYQKALVGAQDDYFSDSDVDSDYKDSEDEENRSVQSEDVDEYYQEDDEDFSDEVSLEV